MGLGLGMGRNCLFCGQGVSKPPPRNGRGSEVLAEWRERCLDSFCHLFHLDPSFRRSIHNSNFCPACEQALRDLEYLLGSIRSFQGRLERLKGELEDVLLKNARGLESQRNFYSKTVTSLAEWIGGEAEDLSPIPIITGVRSTRGVNTEPVPLDPDANLGADSERLDGAGPEAEAEGLGRPKRTRRSRFVPHPHSRLLLWSMVK
jgi:hypothetical protein